MEKLYGILEGIKSGIDYRSEKNLVSSGKFNSINMIAVISAIRENYGVQVPFTEMETENFESADAIYALIERLKT